METENPAAKEINEAQEEIKKASKPGANTLRLEKGAQNLLRLSLMNHMGLSDMADRKASLLISINTLMLSLVVSLLSTKLAENPLLIYPTILLIVTSLLVIVISILSTRPKVSGGTFTSEQIKNRAVNLLFFGNFYQMSLKEFQWASLEMARDREYMFDVITKDIHSLGIVVARKYKYLHLAYNVFMYGLTLCILAYGISFLLIKSVNG